MPLKPFEDVNYLLEQVSLALLVGVMIAGSIALWVGH